MPSRTIRDDKMTVPESSAKPPSSSHASANSGSHNEESPPSSIPSTRSSQHGNGTSGTSPKPAKKKDGTKKALDVVDQNTSNTKGKGAQKPILRHPQKSNPNDSDTVSQPKQPRRQSNGKELQATKNTVSSKQAKVSRTRSDSAANVATTKSPVKRAKSSSESTDSKAKTSIESKKATSLHDSTKSAKKSKSSFPTKPKSMTQIDEVETVEVAARPLKAKSEHQAGKSPKAASLKDAPPSPAARKGSPKDSGKSHAAATQALIEEEDQLIKKKAIKQSLSKQEDELVAKQVAMPAKPPAAPPKPGAYQVQGRNVARVTTGVLSPQEAALGKLASSASGKSAGGSKSQDGPPVVAGSAESPSNKASGLVVAAALSSDMEARIEQEVRRRIMLEAAKAQVVSVAHGLPMLDPKEEARRIADLRELHRPRGVREKLFGDVRNSEIDIATSPESIRKRNYLKWTVKRNQATNMWVATVQTKQKAVEQNDVIEAERTSVSFSATTQQEAFETGLANAVPIMQPTEEHPICYVCKAKFALFRRPQHCRNCGVCVCNSCTAQWPGAMFPDTYRARTTNNVCIACDWLINSFRDALMKGNYQVALHLYATGNINIRSPFCLDRNAEVMFPIHLAVLGGSLKLVKWLVSERHCPLTVPRKPWRGKKQGSDTPLLTSKGRSPLAIAMLHQKLDLVRYLVVDAKASLFDEKDMNANLALANFTTVLKMLPQNFFDGKLVQPTPVPHVPNGSSTGGKDSPSVARRPSM